jgi:YebC/PmpR family DNA-binding regulatory protein
MAGHSKWANIKHQKARVDAKRGKIFTKLIRDLMTAAKQGGGNPSDNPSLRLAMDAARKENMPKDTMERAIKRGTGEIEGAEYVEKTYEGYAPNGVAVIVKTLTDNTTRTVTNVRTAFNKNGGNMGNDGAVAWMFEEKGVIVYPNTIGDEDSVMEVAIEAGADDFVPEGDIYKIITAVADFGVVRDALDEKYGKAEEADLSYIPTQTQAVETVEQAQAVLKLVAALDDDDDVQDVTINMETNEDIDRQLAG